MIGPLVNLDADTAIRRQFYKKDQVDFPVYIRNCMLVVIANGISVGVVVWVLAEPVGALILFPADWLWTIVFVVLLASLTKFVFSLLMTLPRKGGHQGALVLPFILR